MLSKLSWVFFIPFTVAAIFAKVAQAVMPDGAILGLSDMMLDYVSIACVAIVFLFALLFCLFDRKISPYYPPHRNIPAGIFGMILAIVFASDGANGFYLSLSSGELVALDVVESALLLLSSIVFIVLGLTHSFANRENRHLALFNVMPAVLFAVRLVRCFVDFTTISITLADVGLLIAYVFATLFFFNYAVAISMTKAKNAVKSCMIFGLPAAAALFSFTVSALMKGFDTFDVFANVTMIETLVAGLYVLSFLIELTIFVKDKDHIKIVEEEEEEEIYSDDRRVSDPESEESFVITGLEDADDPNADRPYLNAADVEDYIYQAVEKSDSEKETDDAVEATQSNPEDYITNVVEPHTYENKDGTERPKTDYDESIDELDKLILEIAEDYEE